MTLYTDYLLAQIKKQAQNQPDNIAVETTSGQKTTWKNLNQKVDLLAINLIKNGFKKGDRVLFLVKPGIEAIIVLLGVVRAGGVLITADPAMGEENFRSRIELAKPTWSFCESIFLALQNLAWLRKILKNQQIEIPEIKNNLEKVKIIRVGSWLPFYEADLNIKDLLVYCDNENIEEKVLTGDDVQITFTSGTTSKPKGVVHTHESFDMMIKIIEESLNNLQSDIFFTNQYYIAFPALSSGSKVVLNTSLKSNPGKYLSNLEKYKITHVFDVPRNFQQIVDYCEVQNIKLPSSISTIMTGSAPILKGFLQKFQTIFDPKVTVWSIYGMTEMLPIAAITAKEKLTYMGEGDILGKPFASIKVKFTQDQELIVSGKNMCNRFLGSQPISETATGDICKLDSEGRLILMSRKKDMIIKNHFNIYPTLFENTISQIPGVKQCSMVGVYNEDKQDEDIILVVVKDSVESDSNFLRFLNEELKSGKYSIDQYAIPDKIIFQNDLPTFGRSLKVDKKKLYQIIIKNVQQF